VLEEKAALVINGRIRVAEQDRQAWVEAVTQNVEETQRKNGCLYYDVAVDLRDPSLFHLVEAWSSQSDLDAHLAGPEFQACVEKISRLEVLSNELTQFNVASQQAPIPEA
jgi:quinol monooxygenase YgiN